MTSRNIRGEVYVTVGCLSEGFVQCPGLAGTPLESYVPSWVVPEDRIHVLLSAGASFHREPHASPSQTRRKYHPDALELH